jgi:hypothetical protein
MRGPLFASFGAAGVLLIACALLTPALLPAQTSTGTVRGVVMGEDGEPLAGASVTARNPQTNFQRGMLTEEGGFYNLGGLPPATYSFEFSHPSYTAESQDVRVQVGQTLSIDVVLTTEAIEVAGITAVMSAERIIEPTTTEVATNITQEQIENLPLLNRNFLEFAKLAPGVSPTPGGESIRAGGLPAENINLFIDGASYKNDVLQNGIVGQDASAGNPFPQNAVEEFRVITQNYKAEYQKAAGAVVTATTKSGTNEWEGSAFFLGQNENFIAKDPFQNCEAPGQDENCVEADVRDIGRRQFGGTLSGPIVRDRAFVFGSFEGNHRNIPETIKTLSEADIARLPASIAGIDVMERVRSVVGTTSNRDLRSNLFFGKATFQPRERHRLESSLFVRDEFEVRNFGGDQPRSRAEDFNNEVLTALATWQYSRDRLLNEAFVDFQRFRWRPIPLAADEPGLRFEGPLDIWLGGATTEQDFIQDRVGLRNDITYTLPDWNGSHVLKGGAYLDFLDYDITKRQLGNPQFFFRQDENFEIPYRAEMGFGNPDLSATNEQVGLYVQDDWSPSDRLNLNLGIRWDYETNMLNNDWVTPDSVREEEAQFLTPEQQANYFTDGDDRDGYKKMFQPRLGVSYDLTGDSRTVVFGGGGLFFDRTVYNFGLDERFRLQWAVFPFRFSETGGPDSNGNPTIQWEDRFLSREGLQSIADQRLPGGKPEVFLLENDTEPPRAWQWTIGLRRAIGELMASVNYTGVRGYNQLTWLFGNRRPNGSCCLDTPRFGNLLISTDEGRTWYDALMIQLGKPYSEASRWGGQVAYTLSESQQNTFGSFTLDVLSPETFVKFPSDTDERHRLVVNGIVGLPWDVMVSGIGTFASARPISPFVGGDPNNNGLFDDFPPGEGRNSRRPEDGEFKRIDLRLEKEFPFLRTGQSVGLVLEVFNLFDWENFTCFDTGFGDFNRDTGEIVRNDSQIENFGKRAFCTVGDSPSRRLQLGANYEF